MQDPKNAGDWRQSLRMEAASSARWQAVSAVAAAVTSSSDGAQACDLALTLVRQLVDAPHATVLALRGARNLVLASHGDALPPGASIATPAMPATAPLWRLSARDGDSHALCVPISSLGVALGMLCLGWNSPTMPADGDVQAITTVAALLVPAVIEPPRAIRRSKHKLAQPERLSLLSARERQVLALLPRGLTNAALAGELGIAPGTVKAHVERILHKLQLVDRTQAAVYAVQSGVSV
jgi:DNA-binding CsgD family transcriptional regulator